MSAADYAFGEFRLAGESRTLLLGDEPVRLGTRAFDILRILVERAGTVVTTDELVGLVWPDVVVEETNLRVQVGALRKVLARGEQGQRAIETVPRGYRFALPVASVASVDASDAPESPAANEAGGPPSGEHAIPALHNLPALLATPVGRAEAITLLTNSLAEHRLITIAGPGGVGKTTVAIAVARRCLGHFPDGVCFIDLASLSDPNLVTSAVASALGIGVLPDEPLAGLLSHLRKKRVLLLLDTCEHVVDSVATLVEALLSRLPELRILATSREVLRAAGEWAHHLPSLSHPSWTDGLKAADALAYPAINLFVRTAQASTDQFELNDADAATVAAICRRLDGMPLAIEFAAARVGELGVREIAARLDDRFGVLTQGRRTALPRHKTLAATLDWSYQLLPPEEQEMLRQLSAFRGAFTADAAVAVAGTSWTRSAALTHLSNLFAKSLVTADIGGETPLYRLLDTTRAFGMQKLTESESHDVSQRHAAYVLAALRDAEIDYEITDTRRWTERHRHLIDDLRDALDWAMSGSGDHVLGAQLLANSVLLWFALSLFDEYAHRMKAAVALLATMPIADPAMSCRFRDVFGHAMWQTGERIETVVGAFREALEIAKGASLVDAQLRALWGLLVAFGHNGDYEEALAISKQFDVLASNVDRPGVELTRRRMATLALHGIGDQAGARVHAERVLEDAAIHANKPRQRGIQFDSRIGIRAALSRILWLQGFPKQAWACAHEGVELARAFGQALPLCYIITVGVVPVALWTGATSTAKEYTEMLLTSSLEHYLVRCHAFARTYHANLEGHFDACRELIAADPYLADIMATIDGPRASEAALARTAKGGETWCTAELLRIRATRILDRAEEAESLLRQSLDIARRQQALSWELRTATTLAELWERGNRHTEAHDLLAAVYDRFTEGFDTQDLKRANAILRPKRY
ncbi:helix-turn-helix transcriptional regulator [Pendulispora brunnea]|uniref:Helix-turn-helix transcriptional regulator n=1 Tax=Pendulispora brunnea TaxID=2905690 RepID=A0ABZ2KAT3_9BACT